jgi:hypothetical protein
MATVAEVRHARIHDAETKTVEFLLAPVLLRDCRNAFPLEFLGFTEEERRTFGAWLQEFTETGRCVKCIEERLVSGVFDGEEERKGRIEAALQNNLRRLEELGNWLQEAKVRIVHAWQRQTATATKSS